MSEHNDATDEPLLDRAEMFDSYIATLLATCHEDDGDPLDADYDRSDFHPHTISELRKRMEAFCDANADDLEKAVNEVGYDSAQAGADLALSQNGHGAGFFDRNLGDLGDRLQEAARKQGHAELYEGDDNRIYASGMEPPRRLFRHGKP